MSLQGVAVAVLEWMGIEYVLPEDMRPSRTYRTDASTQASPSTPTHLHPKANFDYTNVSSWCCLVPHTMDNCDLIYVTRTHAHTPTTERYIQTAAVVGSNFTMVLPLIFAWRRFGINHKHSWSVPIFILTAVSSTVYHYADTWAQPVLGLSAGQWHRIDNLGAIGSMQTIAFLFSHSESTFVPSLMFIITLILQEAGPWRIENTLIPVSISWMHCFYCLARHPYKARALGNRYLALSLVAWWLAGFCFYRGLDEHDDHMRLYHSWWHVALSVGATLWLFGDIAARDDVERQEQLQSASARQTESATSKQKVN